MKFAVGDVIIVVQDTKSGIMEELYGLRGVIVSTKLPNKDDDRYSITLMDGEYNDNWCIHPDDIKPVSKLEKALK